MQAPIVVPPSVNATVPVAAAELSVAVYVTAWPTVDGLAGAEVTVADVAAFATVWISAADVEVR